MKTILFILEDFPAFGGIEKVTTQLANAFVNQYNIFICSHHQKETEMLSSLDKRVKLLEMPYNGARKSQTNINFLRSILKEHSVSVVIFQDSYFPNEYLLKILKSQYSIKVIAVEHSSPNYLDIYKDSIKKHSKHIFERIIKEILFARVLFLNKRRRTFIYQNVSKYILLSDSLIESFHKYSFIQDKKKLAVIGNPLSLEFKELDLSKKMRRCLFVGRLDVMKGIEYLIEIWKLITSKIDDYELVIVGDGKKMTYLRSEIESNNLRRIKLVGYQSDVSKYYEEADALLMCSTFEGFPLVIPEAMSRGCIPFLFNTFPAANDIVDDKINGILVQPYDIKYYANELLSVLKDNQRKYSMQIAAFEKSHSFEIDTIVYKWIAVIEE